MGFDLSLFESEPVLGIIRGVDEESLEGVVEASLAGGLRSLEITLNTPNPFHLIKSIQSKYRQIQIGAGTVLTVDEAKKAADSGAQFIVAPNFEEEIAAFCVKNKIAYFPGALTPTEIQKAWKSGATMVKVFPASQMGPDYFKTIKGPFNDIKLMAVGGVNPANIKDYLGAGADAVALGGSIFSVQRMKNQRFNEIQKDIEEFMFAVHRFYSKIT
ncbi:MAG: bifunctional 4-hydroxy-2-oxoglutarate aldolase/2-dehydro-3-deoxy-phosphogluconate aldolase [Nitrospinae bacterium]|nr:bifunctional 4-hydroxy-2-oxoglutarate aldolase/2-dehydro-3-deoxy-phosphogluconate aldolase [Nitrospinota bacterium]MZH04192.1 bifunctional 4-hydroxy-2-oxoglutarate aldolase/2-dehydro-3-deoxy-phosphogluconate aldolase [Nitrospinota bacterium]MZH14214.1 bifunctional 4-hydroxy-2-oxoglutarate aldolase/2-dehydro-3-deoxy-phosphogluconate aldolase [Nitrospinota bacterium]